MDAQLTRTKVSFSFCEVYFLAKISYANRAQRELIPRRFADRFVVGGFVLLVDGD